MEREVVFVCSICGRQATKVEILDPGERIAGQTEFWSQMGGDKRRLAVVVDGLIGWTSALSGESDEVLIEFREGDFDSLRAKDDQYTASYCFDCGAWYCSDHSPFERVVYGAPAYDYYFTSTCPRGHSRKVERI